MLDYNFIHVYDSLHKPPTCLAVQLPKTWIVSSAQAEASPRTAEGLAEDTPKTLLTALY